MEVRKVILFSFNTSKNKSMFQSVFHIATPAHHMNLEDHISMVCHNDTVSHSLEWVSYVGISALEWWKLIFHVLLKYRGDILVY